MSESPKTLVLLDNDLARVRLNILRGLTTSRTTEYHLMKSILFALLAPVLICSGCLSPIVLRNNPASERGEQHKFVKSYIIGEIKTVTVGESLLKVQDYWIENIESQSAYSTKDVTLEGGMGNLRLEANKRYPIKGYIDANGVECLVVAVEEGGSSGISVARCALVDADGRLLNHVVASTSGRGHERIVLLPYDFTISNPSVRVLRDSTPVVKATKGYENYELLYTGVSGTGLNLTYREFSPEGLARVAFFQNLTYDAGAKSIAFKKFRIAVGKATSESITFTVLADGYDVKKD